MFDDISGKPPSKKRVTQARMIAMKFFKDMGVYVNASRSQAKVVRCKVAGSNRPDVDKHGDANAEHSARIGGREFRYTILSFAQNTYAHGFTHFVQTSNVQTTNSKSSQLQRQHLNG